MESGERLLMFSKYLLHVLSGYMNKPRFYFQTGMQVVTAGTVPFPGSDGTNRKRKNCNEAECKW